MFVALITGFLLSAALAFSIKNMPVFLKKIVIATPVWVQDAFLYLGYANWLGGVTGHMLAAPLAIAWFVIYKYWLKDALEADIKATNDSRKAMIARCVKTIKGWFGHGAGISEEIREAIATA